MRFRDEYSFLSNFYPINMRFRGEWYKTSEHAYQAAKFTNPIIVEEIRDCKTPGEAKRLAKKYQDQIKSNWNAEKMSIMYEILSDKFKHPRLRQKLEEVDQPIVEDNDWGDTFWGVCDGEGKNNLGKILTRIKQEAQVFDLD